MEGVYSRPMSSIFKHEKARAIREKKKITREEVAAALGCSGSTVYNWEVGNHQPDVSDYYRLCKLLGVEPPELVGKVDLKVVGRR